MSGFFSLLENIPYIMSSFSGDTSSPYKKQQEELAAKQAEYSAALADTNNPLYKQLYGQYRQQGAANLGQGIAEAQAQNRMSNKMGRTALFDSGRGGETIFRNLMQGYQNLGTQADTQTRSALQNALSGTNSAIGSYTGMTPATAQSNLQRLAGYKQISNLLRDFGGGNRNNVSGGNNISGQQQTNWIQSLFS